MKKSLSKTSELEEVFARKLAEQEVSNIITAYGEGWSPFKYALYSERLANIFKHFHKFDKSKDPT